MYFLKNRSINQQLKNRPANYKSKQPTTQTTKEPGNLPTIYLTNQLFNQRINQHFTNQPTNQQLNQEINQQLTNQPSERKHQPLSFIFKWKEKGKEKCVFFTPSNQHNRTCVTTITLLQTTVYCYKTRGITMYLQLAS